MWVGEGRQTSDRRELGALPDHELQGTVGEGEGVRKRLEMKIRKSKQSVPYTGQGPFTVGQALPDPHKGKSLLGGEAESLLTLGGSWDWLLSPRPGSPETDSGALPPCKGHGSTASLKDTTWLSLLPHASFGLEIRGE